jgi:predicted DNA binding CopG/RHH family protein
MPERRPPVVSEDTPIGPDVDLRDEDIRLADGTRLTAEVTDQIVEHVHHAVGRPSLTEPGRHSPQVSARVPAELHHAAKQEAKREGVSMSYLLREALEQYLGSRVRGPKGA